MKECNLECDLQHEGNCTREDIDCTAKTNDDLMTEKEYDKEIIGESRMITDEEMDMMQIMSSVKDRHCRLCGFKTTDKEEFRKHVIECVKKSKGGHQVKI